MKKEHEKITKILLRYTILLAFLLFFYYSRFLYDFLLKLTLISLSFILGFFYIVSSSGSNLLLEGHAIALIPACIGISAYLLLLILNLSTSISFRKRICSLLFSFALFFAVNLFRLSLFTFLLIDSFKYFNIVHKIFWYALSIGAVAGIWFLNVKVFKIENIPIYSDFKCLLNPKRI